MRLRKGALARLLGLVEVPGTRRWITDLVVAEGLCPWASRAGLQLRHWRGSGIREAVEMMGALAQLARPNMILI